MITGNVIGGTLRNPETLILYDESTGIEYTAAMVDSEDVELTATANDIRLGSVAATEDGVTTGEKEIPSYNTTEGYRFIPAGSVFKIVHKNYEYTKLQAIFCKFNDSVPTSVSADKVSINGEVFPVNSVESIATVTIDPEDLSIVFGVINDGNSPYILRFFTYKEIY